MKKILLAVLALLLLCSLVACSSDDSIRHFTNFDPMYKKDKKEWLKLYIPARSAVVLKKVKA